MAEPRVLLFDIEATNLQADFGVVLCIAWKWHGESKVYHRSITQAPTFAKDPTNDKWLIQEFGKVLEQADVAVFHYGMYFDAPYLQTRALYHGMKPLHMPPMVDTWRICRKRLKLHSNRLASIAALLGVSEKTPLDGPTWVRAMAGNKKAIKYVVDHCLQDVVVLDEVYTRIRAFGWDNPNMGAKEDACPTCGSHDLHMRGQIKTVKAPKQRFHCNNCGHWFSRALSKREKQLLAA